MTFSEGHPINKVACRYSRYSLAAWSLYWNGCIGSLSIQPFIFELLVKFKERPLHNDKVFFIIIIASKKHTEKKQKLHRINKVIKRKKTNKQIANLHT